MLSVQEVQEIGSAVPTHVRDESPRVFQSRRVRFSSLRQQHPSRGFFNAQGQVEQFPSIPNVQPSGCRATYEQPSVHSQREITRERYHQVCTL